MKKLFKQADPQAHLKTLAAGCSLPALALLLYHSLAGGSLLAANPYDSYLLQAQDPLFSLFCFAALFTENRSSYIKNHTKYR